jgi:hypothetical protein
MKETMTNPNAAYTPVPPAFINTIVIVEERREEDGNSKCRKYQVTCHPPYLVVTQPGTILNFQLIAPTPAAVTFKGVYKHKPYPEPQLSDPSISLDGKQMTLCDANTLQEDIHVTLRLQHQEREIDFDPQVQNDPKA